MAAAVEPARYRPCVGILMFNDRGQVFVARRNDMDDAWQMPQGGIDPGEAPADAVRRELEEETGVTSAEVVAESAEWIRYDLPDELIGEAWTGRFRGQELKWFAVRFTGAEAEIRVDQVAKPEFDAWRWASLDEVVGLIVPFKRPMYERVAAEFGDLVASVAAPG